MCVKTIVSYEQICLEKLILINKLICLNYYQASSFFLFTIDYRIRFTSFLPGCSPCFKATLAATFFHPVTSFAPLDSYFLCSYLAMFSLFLSAFYSYFLSNNYSRLFLPFSFLACFSSYSSFWIIFFVQISVLTVPESFIRLLSFF